MFDSNNKVLLVEIIDEELQKNNFINLYNIFEYVGNVKYVEFEKNLKMVNEELFLDIHNKRFFDFKKLNEIQQKHSNILVINPWIEFINYEFIATRHLIIKEDKNFLFSKSFYNF